MIPGKTLVQPPEWNLYIPPKDQVATFLTDECLGGIGLSDASQGLQVQTWYGEVQGTDANTAVYLSSATQPWIAQVTAPYISWMRFTFDQNMHPVINFITNGVSKYLWWDPTVPGNVITNFPVVDARVSCSLDDTRLLQTDSGSSDVIMGYINNNNLCYRQQRDRYGIEYVLLDNVPSLIANPFVNKIGMNERWRLQFEVGGQLYQ